MVFLSTTPAPFSESCELSKSPMLFVPPFTITSAFLPNSIEFKSATYLSWVPMPAFSSSTAPTEYFFFNPTSTTRLLSPMSSPMSRLASPSCL